VPLSKTHERIGSHGARAPTGFRRLTGRTAAKRLVRARHVGVRRPETGTKPRAGSRRLGSRGGLSARSKPRSRGNAFRGRPSRFVRRSALGALEAGILRPWVKRHETADPSNQNPRGGRLAKRHVGKTGGNAPTRAGRTNTAKGKNPRSVARPAWSRPGQAKRRSRAGSGTRPSKGTGGA